MSEPATGQGRAHYRGRFAPSPTGPLHFGSLIAAVGSYLQARSQQGEWLIRIDDIDPPREVDGASSLILQTLEAFGFEWDGPVTYQSRRHEVYRAALEQLQQQGDIFPCACTRREIAAHGVQPGTYPGTCRAGLPEGKTARQLRIRTGQTTIEFMDGLQGPQYFHLASEGGDFVVFRADGYYAYQLATAIDDAEQGITEVVRGCDLLDSTPRQILIRERLRLQGPNYCHLPVAINPDGQKLSKQNLAEGLDIAHPVPQLWQAMRFLGHPPPTELKQGELDELWHWAQFNWQLAAVPATREILPDGFLTI